ncbi:hypothetical protein [Paenibacillus thalictri]|uniref:Uncharacterized protein n=1 Tax=Paenibacillus thalictri TaxID=2527873 RepID=A0A4Q9DXC6_9BACL|nr:hypothetical protein [Paenibacillus thalictri]TBL81759.1 hypothetical protein EYB31_01840 [Paenibacillus thalictri]
MKNPLRYIALLAGFGLVLSGCVSSPQAAKPAAPSQPAAPAAEAKDKPAAAAPGQPANALGITQEEAGIKLRVDIPEIKPFLQKAKNGPIVPGLLQGGVPQGIAYLPEQKWILISYYREGGKSSFMSVLDAGTGKLVKSMTFNKTADQPYTGHAGGITASKKHVWLSSDKEVNMLNIDDIVKAADGSSLVFAGSVKSSTRASFTSYGDGVLWIGEFAQGASYPTDKAHYMTGPDGKEHKAWAEGFKLDGNTDLPAAQNGAAPVPNYILSLPDRIQGMYVSKDNIWLSESYGRNNTSTLHHMKLSLADKPHANVTIGSAAVPVWFLDGKNVKDTTEMPPMSEGLFELNGNLHILFESGASTYRSSSSYALDRIQILPWSE